MRFLERLANERGRAAYPLLWRPGVPVPILIGIYLLRGLQPRRT